MIHSSPNVSNYYTQYKSRSVGMCFYQDLPAMATLSKSRVLKVLEFHPTVYGMLFVSKARFA